MVVLSINQDDLKAVIIGKRLRAVQSGESSSDNDNAMWCFHGVKVGSLVGLAIGNLLMGSLSLAGGQSACHGVVMKLSIHPIRFGILMAARGSSASGADDPPLLDPWKVDGFSLLRKGHS